MVRPEGQPVFVGEEHRAFGDEACRGRVNSTLRTSNRLWVDTKIDRGSSGSRC
jgi:hypothetical protein